MMAEQGGASGGSFRRPCSRNPSCHIPRRRQGETTCCAPMTAPAPAARCWSTSCSSTAWSTCSACRAKAISPRSTASTTAPIKLTVCRQEGGAAMMAEAVASSPAGPASCFVTRGPGATNASPGCTSRSRISTPMILFVGQVARDMREREAFQEIDYRAVFGSMAKWATEIDDPARIPEFVSRAFHTAMQRPARPGGDRAARGHAGRARGGRRRAGVRADRDLAGPRRHGDSCRSCSGPPSARS